MRPRDIVLDTNVLVSALRSRQGASFQVLSLLGQDRFVMHLSVPLFLEYEDAAKRQATGSLTLEDIDDILDYIASVAERRKIHFLWRPTLSDPRDDMVLELAVAAGCDTIVTYNTRDFLGSERFGIRPRTPREFLQELGEPLP